MASEEKKSVFSQVLERFDVFVLAVITIIASLAWNDYLRARVLNDRNQEETNAFLWIAIVSTVVLLIAIIITAIIFRETK